MLHMKEHIEILNCDLYIESGQLCFFSSFQLNGFRHLYISCYIKMLLSVAFAKLPLQSCCLSTVILQLLAVYSSAFFCMGFLHFHLYCLPSTFSHEEFQLFQLRVYLQFHFYSSLPSVSSSGVSFLVCILKFPFCATLYTVTFVDESIYSSLALILLLQFPFQSSFSTHSFLKFHLQSSLSIALQLRSLVALLELPFYSYLQLRFFAFTRSVVFLQFSFLQFHFFSSSFYSFFSTFALPFYSFYSRIYFPHFHFCISTCRVSLLTVSNILPVSTTVSTVLFLQFPFCTSVSTIPFSTVSFFKFSPL